MDKLEIGDKVWTVKGIGWIKIIKPSRNTIHYSIQLAQDKGVYWFTKDQVFKYEDNN